MSNTEDEDDWFTAKSPSRSTDSEDAAGEEPTLSIVPAATDAGDDDWFSAVGSVGTTGPTAGGAGELAAPQIGASTPSAATRVDDEDGWIEAGTQIVHPAPKIGRRETVAGQAGQAGQSKLRRYRGALAVAGSALVVVGFGALAVVLLAESDFESDEAPSIAAAVTAAPPTPMEVTPAEATPTVERPWCAGRTDGTPAAVDSADPGVAAIAAFQEAYYVARDGVAARSVVAPDARVADADSINEGIAEIPVGTEHCVLAKQVADGVYAVDLFERRPDTTTTHYLQTVTTDGALITAITQRGG